MQESIKLYVIKYFVNEYIGSKVVIAYWVWIGLMTATIILGVLVSTIHKGVAQKNPTHSEDKIQPMEAEEVDEDRTYREFQKELDVVWRSQDNAFSYFCLAFQLLLPFFFFFFFHDK